MDFSGLGDSFSLVLGATAFVGWRTRIGAAVFCGGFSAIEGVGSDTEGFGESVGCGEGGVGIDVVVGFGWIATGGRAMVASLAAGGTGAARSGWRARYARKPPVFKPTKVATTAMILSMRGR